MIIKISRLTMGYLWIPQIMNPDSLRGNLYSVRGYCGERRKRKVFDIKMLCNFTLVIVKCIMMTQYLVIGAIVNSIQLRVSVCAYTTVVVYIHARPE